MSSGKNSKLSKRRKRSQQKLTMIKKVVIKDSNSDSDSDSNSINQYITPKNKNIVKPKPSRNPTIIDRKKAANIL